jgi:hypothetical protein
MKRQMIPVGYAVLLPLAGAIASVVAATAVTAVLSLGRHVAGRAAFRDGPG